MQETLIKVDNVAKKFCRNLKRSLWYGVKDVGTELLGRSHGTGGRLRRDEFWALKDISFEVKRGECLGLLGRNGAGKSTLLKMLNGLLKPDAGRIEMRGRIAALIELGAGFNPILTGRENIYINGAVLGFSKREIDKKFDAIVAFSELEDFIDSPVKNYSSGMKVRLGFSVAAQLEPDVLLIDEVLAVGDIGFKVKCYNEIYRLVEKSAVIFVSHSMPQVGKICSHGLVMKNGVVLTAADSVGEAINGYNDLFQFGGISTFGQRAHIEGIAFRDGTIWSPGASGPQDPPPVVSLEQRQSLELELVIAVQDTVSLFWVSLNFTDMDQRVVAQCRCRTPFQNTGGKTVIRVAIRAFSLNAGNFALGLDIQEAIGLQDAKEYLVGYRNVICLSVQGEGYAGAAPVQYEADWAQEIPAGAAVG